MARRKPARGPVSVEQPDYTPTIIEFIVDETGSMLSSATDTVNGINDFVEEQRGQAGTCLLTLSKFSTNIGVQTPYTDVELSMVPQMQYGWFIADGGTNLRDTIGARLMALRTRTALWTVKPKVLVVILTDGGDNASRQYSEQMINEEITSAMTNDGWNFVYLGVNQNALAVAERYGIPEGNTKSIARSEVRKSFSDISAATTAYRASSAASTADFFKKTA